MYVLVTAVKLLCRVNIHLLVVCSRITVKTTMQSLCYLDLPQLCLGTLYYPSVTMGDPLTAPKWAETRPKPPRFSLLML